MGTPKRRYRQSGRAKSQEETRQKIVESTVQLHEELGPRATTISAIAERAGVQRLTVYRHFPDDAAIFRACTSHWLDLNPPPDPAGWAVLGDPWARLRAAIGAFYGYYAATRRMWSVSYRDVPSVPALQGPMEGYDTYLRSVADGLAEAFGDDGAVRATVGHLLAFMTWEDLENRGVDATAKVDLAEAWVRGALGANGG